MPNRAQTRNEEIANVISHSLGILFALIAMPIVLVTAFRDGNFAAFYSIFAFGIGLFLVYTFSTLYHFARDERHKSWLQVADHISIYFLIAGTYTPLVIEYLPPTTAWVFLSVLWSIVLLGMFFKLFFINRFEILSVILYVMMGWMLIFVIKPFIQNVPLSVFTWIVAGGLSYSIGVYFYVKSHKLYYHTIWHVFVLLGSIFHFVSICLIL